jgi:hypothetical protein
VIVDEPAAEPPVLLLRVPVATPNPFAKSALVGILAGVDLDSFHVRNSSWTSGSNWAAR